MMGYPWYLEENRYHQVDGNIGGDLLCVTYFFQGSYHPVCLELRGFWNMGFSMLTLGQCQGNWDCWLLYLLLSNCALENPGKCSLREIKQSIDGGNGVGSVRIL